MPDSIRISPSILSADLGRLAEEIANVEAAGADWIHVDVMDGRFVPNITLGPIVVSAVRRATRLPVDVHLMIEEPERYVEAFAQAGADIITVHAEATTHLQRTLNHIRELGKQAGVSLNPHTSEGCLKYLLDDIDLVLVMSVNPGFAGQKFLTSQLDKLRRISSLIAEHAIDLQVDGGVNESTAPAVVAAGAKVLVAGSAIFGQQDRKLAIERIRQAIA